MTAGRIPALLEPIQNRLNAECDGSSTCSAALHIEGCFRTNPDLAKDSTPTDQARLLAAIQAVEEWCLNLDAVEKVNPSSSDNLNASAGAIADVLRKSVAAALGGEA